VGLAAIALLYRGINGVGRLTVILWAGMLATVIAVIGTGLLKFDAKIAFDFPPGAFDFSRGFFLGLGGAMLIAMYDFLGYYDICYVAGEVKEPARVMPRAILISVIAVAAIYAVMNLSIIGLIPWREAMNSKFIASDFMERAWGPWAGGVMTVMILWTAMASVFALLLGYSRIPYAAAVEGYFFAPFGWLHPSGAFPHVSLGVIGLLSIAAGMFSLEAVLPALITARILVQFIGQIGALHWLRTKRPDIERPFRMWLYPLPSVIALAGWSYVYLTSGWTYVIYGLGVVASGVAAFAVWNRRT
jgi:amino acid transporter